MDFSALCVIFTAAAIIVTVIIVYDDMYGACIHSEALYFIYVGIMIIVVCGYGTYTGFVGGDEVLCGSFYMYILADFVYTILAGLTTLFGEQRRAYMVVSLAVMAIYNGMWSMWMNGANCIPIQH